MNKLWILMALMMVLMTIVACGGGAENESVADVAASSAQEITASALGYGSRTAGKVPLHPDVVHGLVVSPFSAKSPLHPDVVHGLVRPTINATVTGLSASPFSAKSPLHPDVVHGLVRPQFQTDLAADLGSTGN
jgi:hypothetical protein